MELFPDPEIDPGKHAAPKIRIPQVTHTWDPMTGAFRVRKVPLALSKSTISKSSVPGPAVDGRTSPPASVRSSTSSKASVTSSMASIPSTFSRRPFPRSPGSYTSQASYFSQSSQRSILPRHIFENLPAKVYDVIVLKLKESHLRRDSTSCQTCFLRDMCTLSLTSKAWDKAVVKVMYDRIELVGYDSKEQLKKLKLKVGGRLKLLRRTLRGRLFLAQHVRVLKVPRLHQDGDIISQDYLNLVASIIMACPNLETVEDFHPIYSHEFDRLIYALSTRRRLAEHMWVIGENADITARSQRQLAPGLMDLGQKSSFIQHHSMWMALKTLLLYSPNQGILEKDIFVNMKNDPHPAKIKGPGILHRLPALENLCIANFDMDDFDDTTLQHLPPLRSLRLQDLEGVTFWGLTEFSRTRAAFTLRNLSLVNLDITYISALSNLCLHLKNLKRLTLVQDTSPELPPGEQTLTLHPIMASTTLEHLHFDIVVPGSAYDNLAASIRAGGFPRLTNLRAPSDRYGQLQALCRPRACVEIPSDWSGRVLLDRGVPQGGLREARRAAQKRLEEAWSTVQFKVVVEEEGVVGEIYDLNGFMGTIGSRIHYDLEPDVEGSDVALVDFPEVVAGEAEGGGVVGGEVCEGRWNQAHSGGAKWWGHVARPRYRGVDLMKFF